MTEQTHMTAEAWERLLNRLGEVVGKRPADLNGVLFLVGMQELGKGPLRFTKEQKQDLMHVGICKLLSQSGYYEPTGVDKDGWPQFAQRKPVPHADVLAQEEFLKEHALRYFNEQWAF